jgi:hypothetical protein
MMHVGVDPLDSVGDVEAGERHVLEGPNEAPEVSRISNMRSRLGGYLGLCVHWRRNWLAVHHASSVKNIESKLALSEKETVCLMLYGDSQKMMEGSLVLHGESHLRVDMI